MDLDQINAREEVALAAFIAGLAEFTAVSLFIVMLLVWLAVGAGA